MIGALCSLRYNTPVKILIFDTDATVREVFTRELGEHELIFVEASVNHADLAANAGAAVVSVFVSSRLTREDMQTLPNLKAVVARSSGIDHIDGDYLKEKGITLYSVPRYGAQTVAEYTFALLLALTRRLPESFAQAQADVFEKKPRLEGDDVFGKTIGVIGTGAIGANVVARSTAFGMQILMHDLYPNKALESDTARYVPLEELYAKSHIITLHAPSTPETYHLLNAAAFAQMKGGVVVVNTARGELVDTKALLDALRSGKVSRAALDVLEGERELQQGSGNEINRALIEEFVHGSRRVIYTPHVAFFTREAYHEILATSAANIRDFIQKNTA